MQDSDLWGRKTCEVSPKLPRLPYEAFSHVGRGNQGEPGGLPQLAAHGSKPQLLKLSSREESTEDLQGVLSESYAECWSTHACEEATWSQGKSFLREAERKFPTAHTRLCSYKSEQKTSCFNVLIALSIQKGISSVVGKNFALNQWLLWSHKHTYLHT